MINSFVIMEAGNQQLSTYNVDERAQFQDLLLSSLFEMEDDLHFPDHNLGSPSGLSDIIETLPDVGDFLLDSTPELDTVSNLLESMGEAHGHQQETTHHTILPDLLMKIAPVEVCLETGHGAPPVVVEPTVQSTLSPASMTSRLWPETSSLDLAINMNSPVIESGEDNEEEDHDDICRVNTSTTSNAKNVVSERNRRKRVSQQMLSLRSLVPNITKMDKRSVLVDALAYLRSIHEEIACIEEELDGEGIRNSVHDSLQTGAQHQSGDAPGSVPRPKGEIIKLETEKTEEKRFIIKMTWKGSTGVCGEVFHMIEAMDLEITYTILEYIQSQLYETTVFIKAKKEDKMTEENLKKCITSSAMRSGLLVLTLGQEQELN